MPAMPAPKPACLPFSLSSACVSRIPHRTRRDTCPDTWATNSPVDSSSYPGERQRCVIDDRPGAFQSRDARRALVLQPVRPVIRR
jgi:hypothetical protein